MPLCDERELELLVCGISDTYAFSFLLPLSPIGVLRFHGRDDLAKFTEYRGYEVKDEECVRSWPPEQQSR